MNIKSEIMCKSIRVSQFPFGNKQVEIALGAQKCLLTVQEAVLLNNELANVILAVEKRNV